MLRGWETPRDGEEVAIINWHHKKGAPPPWVGAIQGLFSIGCFGATIAIAIGFVFCCQPVPSRHDDPDERRRQREPVQVDTSPIVGLRAISAMIIATGHCCTYVTTKGLDFQGGFAVTLFVFISGFIMTVAYVDRCGDSGFDCKFLARRAARLFPVHWVALLLSYPLLRFTLPALPREVLYPVVFLSLPTTAALVQSWWCPPLLLGGNGVAWTMSTFLFFYMAFGPIARHLQQRYSAEGPSLKMIALVSVLSVACPLLYYPFLLALRFDDFSAYMGARAQPLTRLPLFYLGMLAGMRARDKERARDEEGDILDPSSQQQLLVAVDRRSYKRSADIVSVLVLVLWGSAVVAGWLIDRGVAFHLRQAFELACIPLLPWWVPSLTCARDGGSRHLLTHTSLKMIGEWSFSVYLLQMPVWDITKHAVLGGVGKRFPPYAAPLLLAEVVVVAALCHRFVEEPCRRLLGPCFERGVSGPRDVELEPLAPHAQLSAIGPMVQMESAGSQDGQRSLLFQCAACTATNRAIAPASVQHVTLVCGQCGASTTSQVP